MRFIVYCPVDFVCPFCEKSKAIIKEKGGVLEVRRSRLEHLKKKDRFYPQIFVCTQEYCGSDEKIGYTKIEGGSQGLINFYKERGIQ